MKVVTSNQRYFEIDYGDQIETEIDHLKSLIRKHLKIANEYDPRWLAIKLLEGEQEIVDRIKPLQGGGIVLEAASASITKLNELLPKGIEIAIVDRRYGFISQLVEKVLQAPTEPSSPFSERIDQVVTHPFLGVLIFLAVMYLVFQLVANVSTPYLDWIDGVVRGPVTSWIARLLDLLRSPPWLESLILDGIIAGVGGVLVFVPGLVVLFFFIGLLEDSGYMARAAVVMDRLMKFIGLRGKSFVSLVLGFGCAVPAIYATRTLRNRRDRILTTLLVPLMSCSGRLPVFVIFSLAFFGRQANYAIWGLYALGVIVAAIAGLVFSRTILKTDEESTFVIELPAYSMPRLKNLWLHIYLRIGQFIRHAGTVILAASVVIWIFLNLPIGASSLQGSWFGRISNVIAPVFQPAGFDSWESSGALVTGFVAKEVVVSTMSQIYVGEERGEEIQEGYSFTEDLWDIAVGFYNATIDSGKELIEVLTPGLTVFETEEETEDTALSEALQDVFSPLSAVAFLVFVLLYVPCVATLATIRGEFGWKWAAFAAVYQTGAAWIIAVIVYQIGRLFGYA
ncbi:MAG: ferrous iron transport protein B [Anaerolineaceae bacterium]|nr:MAG: ferrous iron transport protein B [Anaerolineaceae bacterium]